jgi:hypothetical protein
MTSVAPRRKSADSASADDLLVPSDQAPPSSARSDDRTSSEGLAHSSRQAIAYCPYCSEETLFPREEGGWECRSCLRAFSVSFLGLVRGQRDAQEQQ